MRRPLLLFVLLSFGCLRAQNPVLDSLERAIPAMPDDTNKVIALYDLSGRFSNSNTSKALLYGQQALELATSLDFRRGIASALSNIGTVYESSGEYEKAGDFLLRSLKIKEEIGNKQALTNAYTNVGELFDIQGNFDKALIYYNKSLEICKQLKDTSSLANTYLNIGILEYEKNDVAEALRLFRLSASLFLQCRDSLNLDDAMNNIGVIHEDQKQLDSALYYYGLATIIRERTGDKYGLLTSYNNIGSVNIELRNYAEAEVWLKKSIELQSSVTSLSSLQSSYRGLAELCDSTGRYKEALLYMSKYQDIHDSLFNISSSKEISSMELKYEQEKKEKEDQIRKEAEEKEQRIIYIFLIAIILIVSVFSLFLFNRFRLIRKQKVVIETKNKEITDSINYARKLQEGILPSNRIISELFPEHFIMYRPKDIVAGDFYWVMDSGDDLFFAVADCTGHGVPGAMVSFICSNALDRTVKEFGITEPGKILDKATELLLESFRKSEQDVADGMDISFCHLNRKTKTLQFSGAHNALWIVRKGELITLPCDNQPVGKFDGIKPFRTSEFAVRGGDVLFLGTDGYADQFGGEKGKKFKTSNLRNMLIANADRPMKEQRQVLEETFDKWKGQLEQVDDVCVMGVRI